MELSPDDGCPASLANTPASSELWPKIQDVLLRGAAPGMVAVAMGPPGIGKTHLLGQLRAGAAAITGVRARNGLADMAGPAPAGSDPAEHAFNQVNAWCAAAPVLMCVDDAHRLPASALHVLRRLAWAAEDLPLALLVGARPFPLRRALDALGQHSDRYTVEPLDRIAMDRLVFDRVGAWPGARLSRFLDAAGGNPLLALTLLRELRRGHALSPAPRGRVELGQWSTPADRTLETAVLVHLGQLDEDVLELIQMLAVLGPSAAVSELAALIYGPTDTILGTVRLATRSGIVRLDADHVAFTHDVYRAVAYRSIDPGTRLAAHRRADAVHREADRLGLATASFRSGHGSSAEAAARTPSPAPPWNHLTAAEMRVVHLVRQGLTNPQIGARLYVSPRTVQTHVSHILAKLGFRSRVEVAAFALGEALSPPSGA